VEQAWGIFTAITSFKACRWQMPAPFRHVALDAHDGAKQLWRDLALCPCARPEDLKLISVNEIVAKDDFR
jgi:hypothetical protein